jgi:hypothetical protein
MPTKKSKKSAPKKPQKHRSEPYYDFLEVMHYLEQLHGKNFRDYAGKFSSKPYDDSIPYLDFWHWLIDLGDISNGCWMYMPEGYEDDPDTEDWKKEILKYFRDFLGKDYDKKMWLEW